MWIFLTLRSFLEDQDFCLFQVNDQDPTFAGDLVAFVDTLLME